MMRLVTTTDITPDYGANMPTPRVLVTQVSRRRLSRLSAFLRTLPKSAFAIGSWVNAVSDTEEAYHMTPKKALECGTTACAFGWAAALPENRRAGLRIVGDRRFMEIEFKGKHSIEAAQLFFQLESEELAETFFMPNSYPNGNRTTAISVANRIDRYLVDPVKYTQAST